MRLIVQKFGGTSVQTKENRTFVIKQIKRALEQNDKVVVIVSAIGRMPDPYATDTLLQLVDQPETKKAKRELDMLIACGEIISSVVLANELRQQGIDVTAITGAQAGLITDDEFNDAKIKKVKPDKIKTELTENDVVIITGFQGSTEDGDVTTLGRGGSDTSAAAFGASLHANIIEIFTDVDGIMTADPRVVKNAQAIDVVTYTEICNLAYEGAKVIHPRAVEIAMQAEIPIRIRSTYTDDAGTLITSSRTTDVGVDIPDRPVTAIAHIGSISQLKITIKANDLKAQADIFEAMAKANISVDFINISMQEIIYTVPDHVTDLAVQLVQELGYEVNVTKHCAKVSAVGAGMTGIPGVAAKITKALVNVGVQVLQSADSHTTIWVLINESQIKQAINALHHAFKLNNTNSES